MVRERVAAAAAGRVVRAKRMLFMVSIFDENRFLMC